MTIALTYEIGAAGSRQVGEIMVSFIYFGVLLLCVVCFACISTNNMVFYIISYDTPPLVSGAVNSANAREGRKHGVFMIPT